LADIDFRHRNVVGALGGIRLLDHHCRQYRLAAATLKLHRHLDGPMLQHLVMANRSPELLPRLQIFEPQGLHRFHRADGFRGDGSNSGLDDPLDDRELPRGARLRRSEPSPF
jgi:hypothetical protein